MLDPLQFYCRVLCNGMKTRFRMVTIAHPGPGIGFHKRFMWRIIILPTAHYNESSKAALEKPKSVQTPSKNTFSIYWTSTKTSSLRSHGAQATLTSKETKEQMN